MQEYQVMASIYGDLLEPSVVQTINPCNLTCHTPIHTIICDSMEELRDLFLDEHCEECSCLHGYVYLYAKADNKWQRITD